MRLSVLLSVFYLLNLTLVEGQPTRLFRDTTVEVYHNNIRLQNAWAGGINSATFGTIDLNGDGRLDLVQFDASSTRVNPFLNDGTTGSNPYRYAPSFITYFPSNLEGWIRTFDYDQDGDMDLFTYYVGGIALYRNDYSPSGGLVFTLVTQQIQTYYGSFSTNIFVSRVNAPALADLDNDGDMDILSFSISGSWVEHHRNYAADSSVAGSLLLYNIPTCWGYFVLSNLSNAAILPPVLPTCPLSPANPYVRESGPAEEMSGTGTLSQLSVSRLRHAGSSLLAFDKDGDGDKDILNGDILSNNLLFLENCGTPDSAWICAQDTFYPSYDVPAMMKDVAGPNYFDGDNDGNKDLVISNFFVNGEDYYNVKFYKNTTNNQSNVFAYANDRWLVDGMIETGTGAHPAFYDVDQDGRTDLLIGNDYYSNGGNPLGKIAYYRNISSSGKAVYSLITNDFAGISGTGLIGVYPAFGDLDGDNDQDMLIGESGGSLVYFQNISGAGNPSNYILTQPNYQSINVGDNAAPQLIDVDRDGLLDLLIGERTGVINYYRNTGTANVAIFQLVTANFGGVNVTKTGSFAGFSAPLLYDAGNGYELLVGSMSGYVHHYDNIDGNLGGTFNLVDSMYQSIFEPLVAVPAMSDVDGDGKFDLVVGCLSGGVVLYTQDSLTAVNENVLSGPYFECYPNPANDMVSIRLPGAGQESLTLEILDVRGKVLFSRKVINKMVSIDVSFLSPGVYLSRVYSSTGSFSRKLIVQ